ncbi:hypothetical protein LXM94_07310 [Rhizobium sp. TRM95111]|uniref:hypothetical protein n=1 Tax=Rhizobium alarense TaxID=2846851 RepID=UPI001F419E4D|nr:hypothetical protein [Rhizobium alarense]MCF3639776.1 hypothetical protein [Rhizobium alarense]
MNRAGVDAAPEHTPLFSPRLLTRLTAGIALLCALTLTVSVAGRWAGERLALSGHTEDTTPVDILIGEDHLRFPANVIRFDEQRVTGQAERVDLYLLWPEMEGYSNGNRLRFNDVSHPESLIFLQLSQSTMSKDMSGRLAPIYERLFEDAGQAGPAGLTLRRLRDQSGYGNEVFLTAPLNAGSDYAVRCMLPQNDTLSTSADCQRDIHLGEDLSVLYRFSSRLLPQWRAMETAVRAYVEGRLVAGGLKTSRNAFR